MTDATATHDPAEIERDIRKTQDDMSRTVDQIGNQLSPRNIINALLDKAENNDIDARGLLDGARRNPIALAMIAGGAIWLISDNDAKLPTFHSSGSGNGATPRPDTDSDTHHRDYISHMERVGQQEGEDPVAYQRRRDLARANYFMVERGHDEEESSFRQRLDDVADKFRQQRRAWSEQGKALVEHGQQAGQAAGESGRAAIHRAQDLYTASPLVGGLVAAAVGAAFGTLLPISQTEQEQLAGLGEKARELADEHKDKLTEVVRDKKDDLVAKVQESVGADQGSGQNEGQNQSQGFGGQSPGFVQTGVQPVEV